MISHYLVFFALTIHTCFAGCDNNCNANCANFVGYETCMNAWYCSVKSDCTLPGSSPCTNNCDFTCQHFMGANNCMMNSGCQDKSRCINDRLNIYPDAQYTTQAAWMAPDAYSVNTGSLLQKQQYVPKTGTKYAMECDNDGGITTYRGNSFSFEQLAGNCNYDPSADNDCCLVQLNQNDCGRQKGSDCGEAHVLGIGVRRDTCVVIPRLGAASTTDMAGSVSSMTMSVPALSMNQGAHCSVRFAPQEILQSGILSNTWQIASNMGWDANNDQHPWQAPPCIEPDTGHGVFLSKHFGNNIGDRAQSVMISFGGQASCTTKNDLYWYGNSANAANSHLTILRTLMAPPNVHDLKYTIPSCHSGSSGFGGAFSGAFGEVEALAVDIEDLAITAWHDAKVIAEDIAYCFKHPTDVVACFPMWCPVCKDVVESLMELAEEEFVSAYCEATCPASMEAEGVGPEDPVADVLAAACPLICLELSEAQEAKPEGGFTLEDMAAEEICAKVPPHFCRN